MNSKRIFYYLLVGYIFSTLILIYAQYNSSRNIDNLISGNVKLLNEFEVGSQLKTLQTDVINIDILIQKSVANKDTAPVEGLENQINNIQIGLLSLQKFSNNDNSINYLSTLQHFLKEKIKYDHKIFDFIAAKEIKEAERLIVSPQIKKLDDSIAVTINNISELRRKLYITVTNSIDESARKARQFNNNLIFFLLAFSALLFWYIFSTIKKQLNLIDEVNESEKKIKELAKLKENFMANMSHEIRTPMNAILGFAQLLSQQPLEAKVKEYVQNINRSGDNLLHIINDILDLSKIESGLMRIEPTNINLRDLIQSVKMMFEKQANDKNIDLNIEFNENVPKEIKGDGMRITQILVNLLSNAFKFTSTGSIKILIDLISSKNGKELISVAVADTGIGIEDYKLNRIFDRFQQSDDSITRRFGGTGLGLTIAKEIVELMQGEISVKSELNSGSTFTIKIPFERVVKDSTKVMAANKPNGINSDLKNLHVLIIEDNKLNQALMYHLLNEWQVSFDIVDNGKEALEMITKKKFDLLLMDLQMPEMDGYSCTREIRNNLKLDIPIIAMSAHAFPGEREKCLQYGMNDYISKPIDHIQLFELLNSFTTTYRNNLQGKLAINKNQSLESYDYIDLTYLHEVSAGNKEYEKYVTELFVEALPKELIALEASIKNKNTSEVKSKAHHMKSTISVMGLNMQLDPYLSDLESKTLTIEEMMAYFITIEQISNIALHEAQSFYNTF